MGPFFTHPMMHYSNLPPTFLGMGVCRKNIDMLLDVSMHTI